MPPANLETKEDLFRVATLGFRGEALPSIGSVAQDGDHIPPTGWGERLSDTIEGGKKDPPFIVGSSVGTSVEIKEIFFNTPARRKFLKSPATELSHICDAVNRMALAHPAVHFRLSHDGRMIADYVAVSERMDRLHQVLGREIAKDLTAVLIGSRTVGDKWILEFRSGLLSQHSLSHDFRQSPFCPRQSGDPRGASRLRDFADEGTVSGGHCIPRSSFG